jgi:bacillithiol synthase
MQSDCFDFKEINVLPTLIKDYLAQSSKLKNFYNRFPELSNFNSQIQDKQNTFDPTIRKQLVRTLQSQYQNLKTTNLVSHNIALLKDSKTFTITTGHQLNIFTGPLYFLYKIICTIKLCAQLKDTYPDYNFVPIYWMATEDHDFDEISFFNLKGQKLSWETSQKGAVGRFSTNGIEELMVEFAQMLDASDNAKQLITLFKNAYIEHDNLSDATRFLVNWLFQEDGLVVLDADNPDLKNVFKKYLKSEITEQTTYQSVTHTNELLSKYGYNIQVNPRTINLFYINDDIRERIDFRHGHYTVLNTNLKWSQASLIKEIDQYPERFSPNVLMRPLYQEVVLPNLCYIGGGGELSYWLQLKASFDNYQIPFPILLLRNSLLIKSKKQTKKLNKLGVSDVDLFLKKQVFLNRQIKSLSDIDIDFSKQKEHLKVQFKALFDLAEQTDKSFVGAVAAQQRKQIKGLEHLEKRLLKAQKRKMQDQTERLSSLKDELFPNGTLQERYSNFSEFYTQYGNTFLHQIKAVITPLQTDFKILEL